MKPTEMKEKFIQMRVDGISYSAIAKELCVSKQTLIEWGKSFQIEIKNFKTIRMEELYEKYTLTKEGRIKLWGELIEKVREELTGRNLMDVSTDKLFDILPKIAQAQDKERDNLTFFAPNPFADMQDKWVV